MNADVTAGLSRGQKAKLDADLQRSSCLYWATRNLSGPPEEPYNGKFIAGAHHLEWDELVSGDKARTFQGIRVCVLAPRDHGKSFFFNTALPIWLGTYGRKGDLGYVFSANQDRANEMLEIVVQEITTNPKLMHLAPRNWESTWSKRRIVLTTGVEIRARGFGVKVRGGHPKWIIGDDMLSENDMTSETIRRSSIEFFLSAITNMVVPGGAIYVVGTPFHQADLYAELANKGVYFMWNEPALNKETGLALWPARYSKELLEHRLKEIGSVRFTREFLVQPFSDEMSLFPSYLFTGAPVQQRAIALGQPAAYWDSIGVTDRYMGVDIAMSSTTSADYLVLFTLGRDGDGNRWVCDIQREKGLGFQAQLDLINSTARRLDPSMIFIESNQMQRVWGDELIRTTDLPIKRFVTTGVGNKIGMNRMANQSQTANKNSLEVGVASLAPLLENRKFRIPRGDARSVELTDIWISEMQAMSFIEGKVQGVGSHDDTVMACVAPGAMVTTERGLKPIEKIEVGDLVLTHKGHWKPVTQTMNRAYDGLAFTVKGSGLLPVTLTAEHPVFRAMPRTRTEDRTNRLEPDPTSWDFVPTHKLRAGRKMMGDYVLSPAPYAWDEGDGTMGWDLADYRPSDRWKVEETKIWCQSGRETKRTLHLDEDFAFLVGLYLAEGCLGGKKKRRHQVRFAFSVDEPYLADFVEEQMSKRFAGSCSRRIEGGCLSVIFSSTLAASFFKQFGKKGGKRLGDMEWPLEMRRQMVRGWLVGDGHIDDGRRLQGTSIARNLLEEVRLTLIQLGLRPQLQRFSNTNPTWQLALPAADTLALIGKPRPEERKRWGGLLDTNPPSITNARSFPTDQGLAVRIGKIQEHHYTGSVYNMHVEDDESYVVEGMAVHNCWIAEQALRRGGFSASFGAEEGATAYDLDKEMLGGQGIETETPALNQAQAALKQEIQEAKGEGGNASGDLGMGTNDPAASVLWGAIPFYKG